MQDFMMQIRTLVDTYQSHYEQYHRVSYNETEVRVDFVTPSFSGFWMGCSQRAWFTPASARSQA